ncbi:MAG: 30S ribosomal protein S8 [Pseudomonas fluorescens]|nr:MAG: 30S ribosomal protein S8 [Pseudomonas fluorescens]
MPVTDPISDLLVRIRNAQAQKHSTVRVPASKLKASILDVLVAEGYVSSYTTETEGAQGTLVVTLKYHQGQPVITSLKRVSTPGRRVYSPSKEIPMVSNGLGTTIVSTSRGVVTDTKARELNVGGEILCQVM